MFAMLRRYLPDVPLGGYTERDLPEGATVSDLLATLGVPEAEARVVFVNGRARPPDWHLQPGDEVGIFPPIGGG
jgi:sulfur carrier protein ThiS